jgi:hypothetical protein
MEPRRSVRKKILHVSKKNNWLFYDIASTTDVMRRQMRNDSWDMASESQGCTSNIIRLLSPPLHARSDKQSLFSCHELIKTDNVLRSAIRETAKSLQFVTNAFLFMVILRVLYRKIVLNCRVHITDEF